MIVQQQVKLQNLNQISFFVTEHNLAALRRDYKIIIIYKNFEKLILEIILQTSV